MSDGFQFIDIIFFAMIAAFLVLRLRSVLGRRDGHEGGYQDPFKKSRGADDDNVVSLPDRSEPYGADKDFEPVAADSDAADGAEAEPMIDGLADICGADPRFDAKEFVSGAKIAFELILGAYASGDTETLESLLNPEVYANFAQAIRDREQAGETLEDTLVGIKACDIVEAYLEDRTANVTVKFISEQINVTRDENGDVVDGNPTAVIDVTDFWTFARDTKSRDPNWILIATRSLD